MRNQHPPLFFGGENRDWLRDHVTSTDKELGRYLKRVSD